MKISIGLARESDCALLADMSRYLIEDGLPWSWTESRVRHCVQNADCAVIVARDGRRTAGFAIMEFHDVHAHLSLLAVRRGYRRLGIGRRMVEWLESSARVAGTFLVRLELRSANEEARAFYRELGYRETGISPNYYAGQEDALRMTRDLTVVSA
jgi:ribosomal protein S18 acetylase RimI-like enzyme